MTESPTALKRALKLRDLEDVSSIFVTHRLQDIEVLSSEYVVRDDFGNLIFEHEGVRYGVAICKDMDFPALGREYAGVAIMLVPAWDFVDDAWLHSRMSILRGVESGYAIARSARNGVLTVSDGYGRVTSEAPSGPQTAYNVTIPRNAPGPTLYTQIGDAFGWSMLALADDVQGDPADAAV